MKSIVVLASTAALAGALATPNREPNPATVEASEPKLPYIPEKYGGYFCRSSPDDPIFSFSEEKCGTDTFCAAFKDQQKIRDILRDEPQYKSAGECLNARHGPPSTP